jgi:drug/metabolite transporter (DMT)-like permease
MKNLSHTTAILLALLVTLLWSTSFIIIKLGLKDIPPLTFAGLRYTIAFAVLIPFMFIGRRFEEVKSLKRMDWFKLALLGLLFYTFTQGIQFIGLSLLPAVAVSLILNFTPLIVAISSISMLSEKPTLKQWIGILLFIIGILCYFLPVDLSSSSAIGIFVMLVGVAFNSASSILGRAVNREKRISAVTITTLSMGFGAIILLISGTIIQGLPGLGLTNTLYLLWLAIINTAIAFTLWNLSLQKLSAMESSIINGTMLIQIAILAWVFLGEEITTKELLGMIIAAGGALLVQLKHS